MGLFPRIELASGERRSRKPGGDPGPREGHQM